MTTFDFSPLFRTAVGFDRMAQMLENASHNEANGYPPYNIELTDEDNYRITLAVAGFTEAELDVQLNENKLTVSGSKTEGSAEKTEFLHRGIANRNFERSFQLAEYVRVEGAKMENGLLHIELVREIPERMKPRTIAINENAKPAIEREVKAA